MVVENTSVITKEDAFNALYISTKRSLSFKYISGALILAAGLFVLIYGTIQKNVSWIVMGALFSALGVAYLIFNLISIIRSPKDIKKRNPDICEHGVTYHYRFREQGLDLVVITNGKKSKGTYKYDSFKKVYEYDDKFEIRLDSNLILYALKSGFQNDRMIDFFKKNISTNKKLKIVKKEYKK